MFHVFLKDSILSEYRKTKELLELLKGKVNGYSILLEAVTRTRQSGAEAILRQLSQQHQHQQSTSQSQSSTNRNNVTHLGYRLVFENSLPMTQVLQRLKYGLVRCLPNRNSNISVIMQLEALLLFDSIIIDPIIHGQYRTEQQRISALLEVINQT